MARTIAQVQQSLTQSVNTTDPSLDTAVGPIYDIMIAPVATEVSSAETEADTLAQLYSLNFAQTATAAQVQALATNYGISQGTGTPATGYGYFMRFTKPAANEQYTITAGTLVASSELSYVFQVVNTVTMNGANANSYYNATRGTYEILVQVVATATGSAYNLPALRVNRITTPVTGFNAFENRAAFTGGTDQETQASEVNRITAALKGRDSGTVGGIQSQVLNYAPGIITDVAVVQPLNRTLFTRQVDGPALDVYIIGQQIQSQTESYTAVGGETIYTFLRPPVQSVTSVMVNNVSVAFTFVQDTSLNYGYSAKANDYLTLSTALNSGDVLTVTYDYDYLIYQMQIDLFSNTRLFNTDILARQALQALVTCVMNVKILPSFDPNQVQNAIEQELASIVNSTTFIQSLAPETVVQAIEANVVGIYSLLFTTFTTSKGSVQNIEVITFDANQQSQLDTSSLVLTLV